MDQRAAGPVLGLRMRDVARVDGQPGQEGTGSRGELRVPADRALERRQASGGPGSQTTLIVPVTRDPSGSSRRAPERLPPAAPGSVPFHRGLAGLACTGLGDGLEGLPEITGNGASPATAFSALATCPLMPRSVQRARPALHGQHMTLPRRFQAAPAGQR